MEEQKGFSNQGENRRDNVQRAADYRKLYRKITLWTLICSLIPLLLVGWAININYARFAKSRMMDSFRTEVEYHRKLIELFLRERQSKLHLITQTHSKDTLSQVSNLSHIFEILNSDYHSMTDLGVIDAHGRHLAYVGPYDLMDKNYSAAPWFRKVMEKGIYISDMFLGFRKTPHFIIAITRSEKGEKWILRATINTEVFRSLVENVKIGKTGEVYLLNREGILQTTPRFTGQIMEKAPLTMGPPHAGTAVNIIENPSRQIMARAWLKEPQWMLVVKQEYAEAFSEVNHANYATLVFLHICALMILIVAVFITRHLIKVIKRRDRDADQLNQQLLQASKLASIGELSAGVAHEINNPLAIILTERQILLDLAGQSPTLDRDFKASLSESLSQIDNQVNRCKRITHSLLRFARRTKSVIETVNLNDFLGEVVELMEREAKAEGIKFLVALEHDLPPIPSDPSQLQQVFLNLITNAIDAHDGRPYGTINISTRSDTRNQGVEIVFADTGSGISEENLGKIFDPFFTTKPVGKGTGLGLSICYSIMKRLGGDLRVKSELGTGTEFTLFLPCRPSL